MFIVVTSKPNVCLCITNMDNFAYVEQTLLQYASAVFYKLLSLKLKTNTGYQFKYCIPAYTRRKCASSTLIQLHNIKALTHRLSKYNTSCVANVHHGFKYDLISQKLTLSINKTLIYNRKNALFFFKYSILSNIFKGYNYR